MEYILVSACLLGVTCRYDGASKPCQAVSDLIGPKCGSECKDGKINNKDIVLIPVCPEQLGGLATPRVPAERCQDKVITKTGVDVSAQYKKGAEEALRIARLYGCKRAILKEKSPSCGCGKIYDGTFSRTLTDGNGVTAELFLKNGISIVGEKSLDQLSQGD